MGYAQMTASVTDKDFSQRWIAITEPGHEINQLCFQNLGTMEVPAASAASLNITTLSHATFWHHIFVLSRTAPFLKTGQ
jgi:hypothetical protein